MSPLCVCVCVVGECGRKLIPNLSDTHSHIQSDRLLDMFLLKQHIRRFKHTSIAVSGRIGEVKETFRVLDMKVRKLCLLKSRRKSNAAFELFPLLWINLTWRCGSSTRVRHLGSAHKHSALWLAANNSLSPRLIPLCKKFTPCSRFSNCRCVSFRASCFFGFWVWNSKAGASPPPA